VRKKEEYLDEALIDQQATIAEDAQNALWLLQQANVRQRVAIHHQHVGPAPGFEHAALIPKSDRLRGVAPGVVLLDLMMPEMDGFEFVAEFRRHAAWRAIPIVVITARDLSRDDRERLNGYVEKILQKGAHDRDQLLAEVRDLVTASVARRRPRI